MDEMSEDIVQLFNASQKTTAVHQKNAIILKEYYETVSSFPFMLITIVCVMKNLLSDINP